MPAGRASGAPLGIVRQQSTGRHLEELGEKAQQPAGRESLTGLPLAPGGLGNTKGRGGDLHAEPRALPQMGQTHRKQAVDAGRRLSGLRVAFLANLRHGKKEARTTVHALFEGLASLYQNMGQEPRQVARLRQFVLVMKLASFRRERISRNRKIYVVRAGYSICWFSSLRRQLLLDPKIDQHLHRNVFALCPAHQLPDKGTRQCHHTGLPLRPILELHRVGRSRASARRDRQAGIA
jgi:hypothetical protein